MPSISPRSALTSVCRPSSAYASTCSSPSATPTAAWTSSPRSGTRAPHGDLGDPERGRAAADRSPLAVLAADALPRLEVAADCVDRAHHLDRPTDEVRAAHRLRDLAVLDQVPLRDAEHEVAGRGVDLPAAEPANVDTALGRPDHLVGVFLPRQDVRVRHPHDGRVRVGLATPVPRRLDAHLPGTQAILEEALQDAVAEELGSLCRLSLVVEVVRAPAVRDRRVVDAVDQLARAPLPDPAAIHRRLLVDRVGLERMADRL